MLLSAIFCLVVWFELTTSHVGILVGDDAERAQVIFGKPRAERSDEYLRGTPRMVASLGQIPLRNYTPLDVTGSVEYRDLGRSLNSRLLEFSRSPHVVLADLVGRLLPVEKSFALQWWLSTFTLLVAFPIWFRLLGLAAVHGALAGLSVVFCTVNMWFSNLPVFLLSHALVAALCGIAAIRLLVGESNWKWSLPMAIALSFYAGRSAFTVAEYPPWGLPIIALVAVCSLAAVVPLLKSRRGRLSCLLFVGIGVGAALVNLIHNQSLYDIVLNTEYPGKRRTTGGNADTQVWGGILSWMMQGDRSRRLGLTNPEMALGPTFLMLSVAAALCVSGWRRQKFVRPAAVGVTVAAVLLVWSTVRWPSYLQVMNPLVLIPAARSSQIAGVIALVSLFLLLGDVPRERIRAAIPVASTAALLVIVVMAGDVERMRVGYLQEADVTLTWVSILIAAMVTFLVVRQHKKLLTGVLVSGLTVASSLFVNPMVVGLGPLNESKARDAMISLSRGTPELRWATTGFFQDALMTSTGVPQLSGQQPLGPNSDAWRKLDPTEASRDAWNRGQAYVNFQWDGRPGITIWNPSPDVIQVVINPCRPELDDLDLGWVVTADEIYFDCLRKETTVTWMGAPLNIYRRSAVAMFEE